MSKSNLPAATSDKPQSVAKIQTLEHLPEKTAPDERPLDRAKQVIPVILLGSERKEWITDEVLSPANPPDDKSLSAHQIRTLQLLANGISITDIAHELGISRSTVHRWLRCHPAVRAMHNRWKQVCRDSAQSRLIALQDTAVEVLAEELETKRNPRIAAMLLKQLGAMTPPQITATTRAAAEKEIEAERTERNVELAKRCEKARSNDLFLADEDRVKE